MKQKRDVYDRKRKLVLHSFEGFWVSFLNRDRPVFVSFFFFVISCVFPPVVLKENKFVFFVQVVNSRLIKISD